MTSDALINGVNELFSEFFYPFKGEVVTAGETLEAALELASLLEATNPKKNIPGIGNNLWDSYNFGIFNVDSQISRAQAAVAIVQITNPFWKVAVDLRGGFEKRKGK